MVCVERRTRGDNQKTGREGRPVLSNGGPWPAARGNDDQKNQANANNPTIANASPSFSTIPNTIPSHVPNPTLVALRISRPCMSSPPSAPTNGPANSPTGPKNNPAKVP